MSSLTAAMANFKPVSHRLRRDIQNQIVLDTPFTIAGTVLNGTLSLTDFNSTSANNSTVAGMLLNATTNMLVNGTAELLKNKPPPHSSHPDFGQLCLLVFEAVLEVVVVALPGYIIARQGMFDADSQKFLANLNVQLFTPCLVFTKLASQLTADKLLELAVIPVIFVVFTLISWLSATVSSRICRFNKMQSNFVTAMAVFGNSNSLPISLVISLSKTISGLHWDRIPGDNDNEVAARGILYLLIYQQLGQLVRWSWGYNVLLKPADHYESTAGANEQQEIPEEDRYRDDPTEAHGQQTPKVMYSSDYASGSSGPHSPKTASAGSASSSVHDQQGNREVLPTPANGNLVGSGPGNITGSFPKRDSDRPDQITRFPSYQSLSGPESPQQKSTFKGHLISAWEAVQNFFLRIGRAISTSSSNAFRHLPISVQKPLAIMGEYVFRFFNAIYQSMNPPLWAMVIAVIVASVPQLQHLFFTPGTFINNSVTRAVAQSGGVAVPLILVVLGANLARNTLPQEDLPTTDEEKKEHKKLLIAAICSRMVVPVILGAPFLALFAKFVPVSILDDPICIIVAFLILGAPCALQLAQICQLHNVFTGVMSKLLFQSYVIWLLPSTLVLVMLALETVEWSQAD